MCNPLSPRASLCRIGPRRQGYASPLRALDGLRADPKDALFTREKGGCGFGPKGTFRPYQDALRRRPRGAVTRRAVA